MTKNKATIPRLIDANPLHTAIALYMAENAYLNDTALDMLKKVVKWVEETCTIDAEPVRHGRWEWREYWGEAAFRDPPEMCDAGWVCSACGTELLQYLQAHFPDIPSYMECASEDKPTLERCPCCGAKMDGDCDADQSRCV